MSSPFLPNVRFINNERDQNFPSSGGFASECPPPARRARAARFPPRPSFASGDSYDLRPTLIGDSDRHISTVLFFFCLPVPTDDRRRRPPICILTTHAPRAPRRSHAERQSVRALCGLSPPTEEREERNRSLVLSLLSLPHFFTFRPKL